MNLEATDEDEGGDPLLLSMLDILSCGIGAAIILLLSFSQIGEPEAPIPRIGRFIVAEFRVSPDSTAFRPIIRPPASDRRRSTAVLRVSMTEAAADGALRPAAAAGHKIIVQGFGRVDTLRRERADGGAESRRLVVLVLEPAEGEWTIGIAPADARRAVATGEPLPAATGVVYTHKSDSLAPAACHARLDGERCVFSGSDPTEAINVTVIAPE